MIEPTIGRVVWYHPAGSTPEEQPHSAQIAHVWSSTCVNLGILDANGNAYNRTSVLLWNGEGERPSSNYAEWMPYQLGQAKAQASTT